MPLSLTAMQALIADGGSNTAADVRNVIQALYDWIPPTQKYLVGRLPGETTHASDDFFSSFSGYTEVDVTGVTTWSATRGGLSVLFSGQASNDFGVAVKPIPAAGVPITIETQATDVLAEATSPMWGLVFTDGTVSTSNLAGFGKVCSPVTDWFQFTGTVGTVVATIISTAQAASDVGNPFLRLTWKAANTFGWSLSPDTQNWTDMGTVDISTAFTPTHMGFFVSAWSAAGDQLVTFRYLRVYEANLSV